MFGAYAQSGYVIIYEPHEGTASPTRRTSRVACPPANPVEIPHTSDPKSISSHWEIPSTIPTLDLGSDTNLSMSSWTDASEPTSPASPPPLSPAKQPAFLSQKPKPSEL